jgi:D-3-phosphoglycerate dehydrogenase
LPEGGVATNDLAELLRAADYVSIHAPATAETRGLFNERTLRLMKPSAYLINTSRGALVDEAALHRALTEGWIAGAAIDVTDPEPPGPGHPLLPLPNTIVTPHAAFYSEESTAELQRKTATQAAMVLTGRTPPNIVNPAVRGQENYRAGV